jgi:hypothetical protein
MKEQGQQPFIVGTKPFVKMKDGGVVTEHIKVIYTSDTDGKTGYVLVEDGCIPVSEVATGTDQPAGIKVTKRLAGIRMYNKEQEGLSPSTLMSNFVKSYDPQATRKECEIMRKDPSSGVQFCGPHDDILKAGAQENQNVML